MRVSAILAVRDGLPYLPEAIDSMLAQSRPPDEVIVVDDGSTDATRTVLERYSPRIHSLARSPQGQPAALLAGIAVASGDVLAFQDADDIWPAPRLGMQLAAMAGDPSVEAVFGHAKQFVSPELPLAEQCTLTPSRSIIPGEITQCMLIRRTAYDRVGPFDSELDQAFFYDWLARAKAAGLRSVMLDDVVLLRRLHRTNYGRVHAAARDRALLRALRRRIQRASGSAAPCTAQEEPE